MLLDMNKTTKPLERIYLTAFGKETIEDGIVYTFLALDDYSEYLFMLGTERVLNEQTLLNNIINLLNKKEFYQNLNGKFTLVLPFGDDIKNEISTILSPYNGSVIFNNKFVSAKFKPVFKELEKY